MSDFLDKRTSLEQFVKEQIIGPGAYNKRFFFLDSWEKSEFAGKKISSEKSINNVSEIIPEVPAYQYSSAILFPETREKATLLTAEIKDGTNDENDTADSEIILNPSADDDNLKEDTTESVVSKQQNYPNVLGLTFVVDRKTDFQKDLTVSLSFRKYSNVKKRSCFSRKIAIWVSEYETEIEDAIIKHFNLIFSCERKDDNLFITVKSEITGENLYDIDYIYLNKYLESNLINELRGSLKDKLIILEEDKDKGIVYYGLLGDYDKKLYSITSSKSYNRIDYQNVFTLFDYALIELLKDQLEIDTVNYSTYKELIKQFEIYSQLKDIVTNLKSIYKDNQATTIWESKLYNRNLSLPLFDATKKIFRNQEPISIDQDSELKDLKYTVQYITDKDKIFIKILLINKSFIDLKNGEPRQLNKKDKANVKSYFGVELRIEENKASCLKQYNPPQLLEFDEEDNFNKLIYRRYIDYGEGYNTSVTWGANEANLKYVSTDFLPEQETPKVDFKPSKIVGSEIVSRLNDEQVLSMRYLSTLSINTISDADVLNSLSHFIDAYKIWIDEKRGEVESNAESLDGAAALKLLTKQIKACVNDYNRLKRNIELLKNDKKAIVAFRIMNTAMFMQLHHSINSKGNKSFIPDSNSEEFYSQVTISNDYKWRSFQLAFILLNVDAFVKPKLNDATVKDVFGTGWPERNEIADLVWFPTGGGKTEAYLGIIAFAISYRRFKNQKKGYGTTVLMRYTLRMLTLQQFQRATILICALEAIRKDKYFIPHNENLGTERITIGLFVGGGSLPNYWAGDNSMTTELTKISEAIEHNTKISTNLPFTNCPWCGGNLFIDSKLPNIKPNHTRSGNNYGINDQLNIACNSIGCTFYSHRSSNDRSLPLRLFDDDIYKYPPTLLFGTVDKFAAFANNVSTEPSNRNKDSRRIIGNGYLHDVLPPELIIQDELHLLLGPLGSSVGLFEKSIDVLCTYTDEVGNKIKPKIITSTATTRNTDKQIFALFNRRSEIFPKQGIFCDDSFFAFYERNTLNVENIESNRKYVGVLPIGKTQVWMQLRVAAIVLTHRLKYLKEKYAIDEIFEKPANLEILKEVFDYYHTVLAYFNSLKDVGKTQSQLSHYLPGDINYVTNNTIPWSFLSKLIRKEGEINYSELTGRLTGEEVKTNLSDIEKKWSFLSRNGEVFSLNTSNPPEFVISTNMISVGIDVSRFNTMIISSMPRNVAEYIQASSRVARNKEGIVFTIHHPLRSRDISHYQKFKEFHEKFYSYVEPISVTPFASKALDRYLAMFAIVLIRHNTDSTLNLRNNDEANQIDSSKINKIRSMIQAEIIEIHENSVKLESYLNDENKPGIKSSIDGIISQDEVEDLMKKLDVLLKNWIDKIIGTDTRPELKFRTNKLESELNSLFINAIDDNYPDRWKVSYSLREIGASTVIKTVQQ